jgi:nicotinate-nucleotide pyrophosphorylase (carboxylating)
MKNGILERPGVMELIERALIEDVGSGDASSLAVLDPGDRFHGRLASRAHAVVAGVEVARAVFSTVDPAIEVVVHRDDGDSVAPGELLLEVDGPARGILTAERNALNFLQRMSGIATLTREYVNRVEGYPAVILDTRKTMPTLRVLEKYAVVCGGGRNHRMGLYDRIMLKDNHLAQWRRHHGGDLADMVRSARESYPDLDIEVEVDTVDDCRRVLAATPEWILLDNMNCRDMQACVELVDGRSKLEASGNVNLDTVRDIAATGVDAISVGALTHSSIWVDFGLDVEP